MTADHTDYDKLTEDIKAFNDEREQLKRAMTQVGNTSSGRADMLLNVGILLVVVVLFALEVFWHLVPAFLSLEIGVFLVSVKVVLMMHAQQKATHFQFWMLSTLEYRIGRIERELSRRRHDSREVVEV